jgi:ATP-dependent Lon protease
LGNVKFFPEMAARTWGPGLATGLAWTPAGGDILFIEASSMKGNKNLTLTGHLGDVMKESAIAALTYIRSHVKDFGVPDTFFDKKDIHIHVPAGAIPKDGPSAGVAILVALASLVMNRPVRKDVAMTGEITLRGRVLPIGGLKQKILAAHLSGAKIVIIPRKNEKDLRDIPDEIRKQIKIIPVDSSEQALDAALRRKPVPLAPKPPAATKQEPAPKEEPESSGRVRRPAFPPADQPTVIVKPVSPTGWHGGRSRPGS